jgi:hypothetical protein
VLWGADIGTVRDILEALDHMISARQYLLQPMVGLRPVLRHAPRIFAGAEEIVRGEYNHLNNQIDIKGDVENN